MSEHFSVAVAVNSRDTLDKNLLRSPDLANGGGHQLIVKENFASASLAYNSAIDEATNDIIVFVHQDIYLPETWFADLRICLASLEIADARWGVLGCFGSRRDAHGGLGRVYTRGLGRHGRLLSQPEPVETLDEILLVLRKSSGLRFDPDLPYFHLYGADLCMAARDRGMTNFAFQGFLVHNTNQLLTLPPEFYACYRYLRRKWAKYVPISASCMTISSLNGELYRRQLIDVAKRTLGMVRPAERRVDDPRVFLEERAT